MKDRIFGNQEFMNKFAASEVHHLIRLGSDHAPLQLTCCASQELVTRYFKFLNF